eukprot:1146013-Pelagomonas_calceolata.AAC.3
MKFWGQISYPSGKYGIRRSLDLVRGESVAAASGRSKILTSESKHRKVARSEHPGAVPADHNTESSILDPHRAFTRHHTTPKEMQYSLP